MKKFVFARVPKHKYNLFIKIALCSSPALKKVLQSDKNPTVILKSCIEQVTPPRP